MVLTMLWWGRTDSNHRSESQQIYSLPPLATRELPHLELHVGVEPTTCWLQVSCSAIEPMKLIWWKQQGSNLWPSACKADALPAELCFQILMVTPRGIEPLLPPWKGGVLTAWPRGLGFFLFCCALPSTLPIIPKKIYSVNTFFKFFLYIFYYVLSTMAKPAFLLGLMGF